MIIMLNIKHFSDQFSGMVIINQCNCTGYFRIFRSFLFDQFLTNHIAKNFGAVGVFLFLNQAVEFNQQIFFQRNTETNQIGRKIFSFS